MTMVIRRDSDRHERRRGRNFAVLIALIVLVALLFAVTTVKLGPNAANPSVGKTWGTSLIEWLQGENVTPAETGEGAAPGGEAPGESVMPGDIAPDGAVPNAVTSGESMPDSAPGEPASAEPVAGDAGPNGSPAPGAASDLSAPGPEQAATESASGAMMPDEAGADAVSPGEAGGAPGNGSNERMPE